MLAFSALSDATRRQIVEMLAAGELPAGEIARRFEVTAPAISQHLRTLRSAKLVRVRAEAQRRIYALDPAGLSELERWLKQVRRSQNGRLDALERPLRPSAQTASRRRSR